MAQIIGLFSLNNLIWISYSCKKGEFSLLSDQPMAVSVMDHTTGLILSPGPGSNFSLEIW